MCGVCGGVPVLRRAPLRLSSAEAAVDVGAVERVELAGSHGTMRVAWRVAAGWRLPARRTEAAKR